MEDEREFRDWEKLYREEKVEELPWFHRGLDHDLARALEELGLKGGTALDLGTGPGTQAMALARRGFKVTATDLSETAITNAAVEARKNGLDIEWMPDDILDTRLSGPFDFVFDRGCFHVLPPDRREDYARTLARLVRPGGYLFLKCFSHLETMDGGPYRFTPEQLREIFSGLFTVAQVRKSVFLGTLKEPPKALFCVLKRP
ncbi:MAG: class I SAM-dependent methyltransferase [Thermodesulfobacteriota bacterium]